MSRAPKYLASGTRQSREATRYAILSVVFKVLFRKKLPDYRGAQIAFELRVMLDIDSVGAA